MISIIDARRIQGQTGRFHLLILSCPSRAGSLGDWTFKVAWDNMLIYESCYNEFTAKRRSAPGRPWLSA